MVLYVDDVEHNVGLGPHLCRDPQKRVSCPSSRTRLRTMSRKTGSVLSDGQSKYANLTSTLAQ
jgi:hypothetical protein